MLFSFGIFIWGRGKRDGMRTVLVTGGAGFIGSHLCEFLLEKGDRIICLDNFFTGNRENIAHLLDNERFVIVEHDIIDPYVTDERIDEIYNLACPASPVHYQKDPVKTLETSVIGTRNMLELATRKDAKLLQASTSEVYGDPEVHPQSEAYNGNVNPTGPRACYDEGKRAAETLCFDYLRSRDVEIRVARIFNTYGPRMAPDDGRVVSNFIVQALSGKPITVYGDGKQTRSFCYVSDMVHGLHRLMNSQYDGPVNLGNPDERGVWEVAETIKRLTGSGSEIIRKGLPEDDPKKRRPDISLAEEQLGWRPRIEFEEGLKITIEDFRVRGC